MSGTWLIWMDLVSLLSFNARRFLSRPSSPFLSKSFTLRYDSSPATAVGRDISPAVVLSICQVSSLFICQQK